MRYYKYESLPYCGSYLSIKHIVYLRKENNKMEKSFKETNIPNDLSCAIAQQGLLLGPTHVPKIATSLFSGISKCLGSIKDVSVPKAVVFKTIDGKFIAAAYVKYSKNDDGDGNWNYSWTFNESDIDDTFQIIDFTNALVIPFITNTAHTLFSMRFADNATCVTMMVMLMEMILGWIKENTKDGESAVLNLPGVFTSTGDVVDGNITLSIVPDGDMKVMIKDDSTGEG
jgi:hypothetical protein